MKKYILSALAGAVVAFVWSAFSHMALPWHNWDMKSFQSGGSMVAQTLKREALEPGLYFVPNIDPDMHRDETKRNAWHAQAAAGPFAYMSVRPQGDPMQMGCAMFYQFLTQLLVASLGVLLLRNCCLIRLVPRAGMVCLMVLAGALSAHLPYLIWWKFPVITTLVNIVDTAATWFLAGLAMAKTLKVKV